MRAMTSNVVRYIFRQKWRLIGYDNVNVASIGSCRYHQQRARSWVIPQNAFYTGRMNVIFEDGRDVPMLLHLFAGSHALHNTLHQHN